MKISNLLISTFVFIFMPFFSFSASAQPISFQENFGDKGLLYYDFSNSDGLEIQIKLMVISDGEGLVLTEIESSNPRLQLNPNIRGREVYLNEPFVLKVYAMDKYREQKLISLSISSPHRDPRLSFSLDNRTYTLNGKVRAD